MKTTCLKFTLALSILAIGSSVHAGAPAASIANSANASVIEPAVSGLNGKIDGIYGAVNQSYMRGVSGSVSVPVGQKYGAQLDGSYIHGFETDIYGVGGHFFRRNPAKGLLGLAFGGLHSTDFTDILVGVEGELYFKSITLGTFIGYNNADAHVPPAFIASLARGRDFIAARLYATAYLTENLAFTAEYQNRFERNFYIARLEYLTPVKGLALFADAGLGDNNYRHLMGGVRFYFGGSNTLKDRHRKDDPDNINNAFSGSAGAGMSGQGPTNMRRKKYCKE